MSLSELKALFVKNNHTQTYKNIENMIHEMESVDWDEIPVGTGLKTGIKEFLSFVNNVESSQTPNHKSDDNNQ